MEKRINISWSTSVKIITVVSLMLIAGLLFYFAKNGYLRYDLMTSFLFVFVGGILVYFGVQAPISLSLTQSAVVLNKVVGKVTLPYAEIQKIEAFEFSRDDIRVFGSGGFCGYIGRFRNKTIGNYSCYVGDTKEAFLIQTTNNHYYVFSCEEKEAVINEVNLKIRRVPYNLNKKTINNI